MISRIVLGTAQFGEDYGAANRSGKVAKADAFEILQFAGSKGMQNLDTASAYGDSENVIGEFLRENGGEFDIISKIPRIAEYKAGEIRKLINGSLSNLRQTQLYGYLIHRFDDYLENNSLWEEMQSLKSENLIKKIGFSLYSPNELETLFDQKVDFDILQIPYSVFDRRFEKYFDILKSKNIEIHARSIFLQGLAFLDPDNLEGVLIKAETSLRALQKLSIQNNVPVNALCLNFVLMNPLVDKVLIGVDGLSQLKDNIKNLEDMIHVKEIYIQLKKLNIEDEEVLLPYRWEKVNKEIKHV